MRYFAVLIMVALMSTFAAAQSGGGAWSTLASVVKTKEYDESMGFEVERVQVGLVARMLDGQQIEIEGYIIPLEGKVKQSHFMLSAFPANLCFFCGKAGPETAMQVFMNNNRKVAYSDQKIKLQGTLRINEADVTGLLYTLEDATLR